jgi:hypothetical protein
LVIKVEYPFDLGMKRNFRSVFGEKVLNWFLITNHIGDGMNFEIKKGEFVSRKWPPVITDYEYYSDDEEDSKSD